MSKFIYLDLTWYRLSMLNNKSKNFNILAFISAFCFIVALLVVSFGIYSRYWYQNSDGAGFMELIIRSFNEKQLISSAFSGSLDFVQIVWNPIYDCTNNSYLLNNSNISFGHPYNISYLLSFISNYLPISPVTFISLIFGVNYLIPLYVAANLFFRKSELSSAFGKKLNRTLMVLVVVALIIWPPYLVGIQGQFYFDRLSISLFFILAYLIPRLHKSTLNSLIIFFVSLFIVPFISERTTIVSLICSFCALLFIVHKKVKNKSIIALLIIHIIIFSSYYFYWKNYISDPSLNTIPNITNIIERLTNLIKNPVDSGLLIFLLILIPILLMSVFSKVNFLLIVIVAAPNLIFNVGGAELNGYITHYHSLYVGFAIAGVLNSFEKFNLKPRKYTLRLYLISSIFISLCSSFFYYGSYGSFVRNLSSTTGIEYLFDLPRINQDRFILEDDQKSIFNPKSTYTIPDGLFPTFIDKNLFNIHMFPVNLGKSDYVITEYSLENNLPALQPWIYPEKKTLEKVQLCLQERLDREYKFLFQKDSYFVYKKLFN